MQYRIRTLALTFLMLAFVACSNSVPTNSAIDVELNVTPPPTQPDKATVIGRVYSANNNEPLATTVRLAEVVRQNGEAVMALDGANSPGAQTNPDGTFVIPNIDAKEYVVVVGDIYGEYVIISEAQNKARVYEAKAGQVTNVGELRVGL